MKHELFCINKRTAYFSLFLFVIVGLVSYFSYSSLQSKTLSSRAAGKKGPAIKNNLDVEVTGTPMCANGLSCPSGWVCNGGKVEGTSGTFTTAYCTQSLDPADIARSILHMKTDSTGIAVQAPILSLFFYAYPEQILNANTLGTIKDGVETYKEQRLIIEQVMDNNGIQSFTNKSVNPIGYFGLSECGDSRCKAPSILWTKNAQPYQLVQSSNIAAQPVLFPEKTQASLFVAHISDCASVDGCGALGGIKVLLKNEEEGIAFLRSHHVPEDTIIALQQLIRNGTTDNAYDWALMAARIQADLNQHPVVAVVSGHADNTFQALGVWLPGNSAIQPIDDYPLLKEIVEYLNNPLPIDAGLASGQAPKVVAFNFSKKWSAPQIYGALQQQPGNVFKIGLTDLKSAGITMDQIDAVGDGAGYGLRALKNGKVAFITADTLDDLHLIRARLALRQETNGIQDFLKNGGVIVSSLLDKNTGKIGQYAIIENAETGFGAEKLLLSELSRGRFIGIENVRIFFTNIGQKFTKALVKSLALTEDKLNLISKTFQILNTSGRYLFRVVGSVADVYTLIDLSKTLETEVLDIGEKTSQAGLKVTLGPSRKKGDETTEFSFSLSRKDLVTQHAKALLSNMGKLDDPNAPWRSTRPEVVGKLIRISLGQGVYHHQFLLRTGTPPNPEHNYAFEFVDTNPQQAVMLVSPEGFVVSGIDDTETYTLSYIDKGWVFENTEPQHFYVWRITPQRASDQMKFSLIGKVKYDKTTNSFSSVPLIWNTDF